jgi:hypothetical protein
MLPFHLCCNLTCVEFYECDTPNVVDPITGEISKDIKGIEEDRIITTLCRYLEYVTNQRSTYNDLQPYGRQNASQLRMFCELADIKKIRIGTKARFNLTTMFSGSSFDRNLKPFDYNSNQRDIIDMEVREINFYAGLNSHYEIDFQTFN